MGNCVTEFWPATKIKCPNGHFIFVEYDVWTKHLQRSCQVRNQVDFGSKTHQNRYGLRAGIYAERILHLRQYSDIYADIDKKPAVLRDFLCIDSVEVL